MREGPQLYTTTREGRVDRNTIARVEVFEFIVCHTGDIQDTHRETAVHQRVGVSPSECRSEPFAHEGRFIVCMSGLRACRRACLRQDPQLACQVLEVEEGGRLRCICVCVAIHVTAPPDEGKQKGKEVGLGNESWTTEGDSSNGRASQRSVTRPLCH